jgi:hypothetical protein
MAGSEWSENHWSLTSRRLAKAAVTSVCLAERVVEARQDATCLLVPLAVVRRRLHSVDVGKADSPQDSDKRDQEHSVATDQERISDAFSFVLKNRVIVFPVQMKHQKTGRVAFRVSKGGAGGNTLDATEQVDEATMVKKVFDFGYAVRCASKDGTTTGQYKIGHRSVSEVRRKPQ